LIYFNDDARLSADLTTATQLDAAAVEFNLVNEVADDRLPVCFSIHVTSM